MQRKIIHIDCDCYYAALEVRDFPELAGRPLAVGGTGPRSVLSTCNYEARRFGIHSAMPTSRALSLCPQLLVQSSRFDVYRSVSEQIFKIIMKYSKKIETLSLDEAFIDVTESTWFGGSATLLAEHIRQEIYDTVGITVSAGVAPNKFLAKVASDWNKPNGTFVVPPKKVAEFVRNLPVKKINGVGTKTAERLNSFDIHTCGDIQEWALPRLIQFFGKSGPWLYNLSRGIDERAVGGRGARKSMSIEHTFEEDLANKDECLSHLPELFESLMTRLDKKQLPPLKSLFVKVRFNDFTTTTMERPWALDNQSFGRLITALCAKTPKTIRLMGLGVRFKEGAPVSQMCLWDETEQAA